MPPLNTGTAIHPLAFCFNHGVFEFKGIELGIGASISIEGVETPCPACGQSCEYIPGTQTNLLGKLKLLVDKSASPEMRRALIALASKTHSGAISPKEAIAEADEFPPELKELLQSFLNIGKWALPLLISILSLIESYQGNRSSSELGEAILKELKANRTVLEQMGRYQSENPSNQGNEAYSSPSPKSSRRNKVYKDRRKKLLEYRKAFRPKEFDI